jgi:hypothetical protein
MDKISNDEFSETSTNSKQTTDNNQIIINNNIIFNNQKELNQSKSSKNSRQKLFKKSNDDLKSSKPLSATSQIGGKGTIRRRRLRHHLRSGIDAEHVRLFHSKFKLIDLGHMERVTFIQDNGDIISYDSIPVHANYKSHIFHFDLSKYKNHRLLLRNKNKNSSALTSSETTNANAKNFDSSKIQSNSVKLDRAKNLLNKLDFINKENNTSSTNLNEENCEIRDLNQMKLQINQLVGSQDAYAYLSGL